MGNAIPLINDLEIGSIFKNEDKEEGDSIKNIKVRPYKSSGLYRTSQIIGRGVAKLRNKV